MKLFVFISEEGAVECVGVVAESYEDALEVMDPMDKKRIIDDARYCLKLKHTFELKEGKRGVAFRVSE